MSSSHTLSQDQINNFDREGYLLIKSACEPDLLAEIKQTLAKHLADRVAPFEREVELQYPGAPAPSSDGDKTIRRLKQAYDRANCFAAWAKHPIVTQSLKALLGKSIYLVRAHHNCIMTKHPKFSSDSCWHQDLRYWQYSQGELISAWLALGVENEQNGALQVIPGSHRTTFNSEQFDDALFFRQDFKENSQQLQYSRLINLEPGDLLLFHCRLLHSATRNFTDQLKTSLVYTYRKDSDTPLPNSHSAAIPDVKI